jgi:EmrB/QacA subfamily drug resistance transporter
VGLKNIYIAAFFIYGLATILSGIAWNIDVLIIYQILQGIGAGLLMPASMALVSVVYPPQERGRGMVYWSIANSLGGSAGPVVGGYLADNFSWRLVFFVNTPLALGSMIACLLLLKKDRGKVIEKFDYAGFALLSVALVSILLVFSQGRIKGWTSNFIISLVLIFFASFGAWIAVELKVKKPLIDLTMFKNRFLVVGMIITFLIGISLYGTNFLMPLFLQIILNYTVLRTAAVIVVGVLISVVFGRIGGSLADKYSPRLPLLLGVTFWALFSYYFSFKDARASFYALWAVMVIRGVGYGLSLPPMMSGSLTGMKPQYTTMASGIINLTFTLGGMFGIAILGTLLDIREIVHYTSYASDQNLTAHGTMGTIKALQSYFMSLGHVSSNAEGMAVNVLTGIVRREALVSAFQDCFVFLMGATLIALAPSFFMGKPKKG